MNSGMMTGGGAGAAGASSPFGASTFVRGVGFTIGRGGRTASFFAFSGWGLSSRMMTLRARVVSFLPVINAWMTSGSRIWFASVISAPSDCNWKMTSFSDFPILFAMSVTRIFAAAI